MSPKDRRRRRNIDLEEGTTEGALTIVVKMFCCLAEEKAHPLWLILLSGSYAKRVSFGTLQKIN